MPLSTNDISTSSGEKPQEIYISKERLTRLENVGQPEFLSDPVDLAIRLVWSPEGRDFEASLDVFGNFERDGTGRVTGWGGAFTVGETIKMLGFEDLTLTEDNQIPNHIFEDAVGVPFFVLRYVADRKEDDRLTYYTFSRIRGAPETCSFIESDEEAEKALEHLFYSQVGDGWVDDFRPELIDNGRDDDSEPSKEPAGAPAGSTDEAFEPNDELPF